MKDFRQLKVWDKAHQLTLELDRGTARFPREEKLRSDLQIRRAGSSICANLAGGCVRDGDGEFARFCSIAGGSASELEYHLLLASAGGRVSRRSSFTRVLTPTGERLP